MTNPPQPQIRSKPTFLVSHQGTTQGPFDLDFIEAMVMAQVYPPSVLVQKTGEAKWLPLDKRGGNTPESSSARPPATNTPTGFAQTERETKPSKTKPETVVAWVVGIFAVLVVLWIMGLVNSSNPKNNTQAADTSYQTPPSPPTASKPWQPPSNGGSNTLHTPPSTIPNKETAQIFRDASGRTYRVPNSEYHRLLTLQSALAVKKSNLDLEERRFESLSSELDSARIYLDRTSQYAVDAFNEKVNKINGLKNELQSMVDAYNRDVHAFNADLERVGTPIY